VYVSEIIAKDLLSSRVGRENYIEWGNWQLQEAGNSA
jgi:hypothetical protein